MAPEVEKGIRYDATVDLYSLGIVLYKFMNRNRFPFINTEQQLLNPHERVAANRRRLDGEPLPSPCDASPAMAEVILRACSPDLDQRFSSAAEMKDALLSVANGTYSGSGGELHKIHSVQKESPTEGDGTVSVRKAVQEYKGNNDSVHTFGGKGKSSVPKIIAVVLTFVFVVGIGMFTVPKFTDRSSKESSEAVMGTESKKDEEIEYAEALAAQVKVGILAKATGFADAGDYVSAIKVMKDALKDNADLDYQEALKTYGAVGIVSSADEMAAGGEYIAAIQKIEEAVTVIGEDTELSVKEQEYKDAYVSGVII